MISKTYATRSALMAAASSVVLLGAGQAFAQTPASAAAAPAAAQEPSQVEEVIVTGFRASLQSALNAKKNSNLIIESVTAEDMGKFPDQNIAESLQRLPGVQIDRENGQGTKVRIRGLDQNVTVLNNDIFVSGLELFRLGEGKSKQTNSLEGIPSELIGGVDVYKSPDASLLEGGLGGVVNLKTRNARSLRDDVTIAGDLRANKAGDTDWNPTGSLVLGYKFSDRFAVLGTISYDKTEIHTDVLGGENRGGWAYNDRPVAGGATLDVWSPEYRYATYRDQERKRLGASLNLDFALTDSLQLTGDWFHSDLKIKTSEASIKFPFANENATYAAGASVDGDGVLQSGTLTANSAEGTSYFQNAEAKTDNFQVALNWDNGGRLSGSVRAAYSTADYTSESANNDVRYTQYTVRNGTSAGLVPNATAPATFTYSYANGDNPKFTPANPAQFTTPSSVFAKSHWVFGEDTQIDNTSIRGDLKFRPEFGESGNLVLTAGVRYAERKIDSEFWQLLADYSGKGELNGRSFGQDWTPYGYFQDGAIGFKSCELPVGTPGRPTCSAGGRFGDSPALITPYQTAATNPERFETLTVGGINALFQKRSQMSNPTAWLSGLYSSTPFKKFVDPIQSFRIKEKTTTGYGMVDLGGREDRYHVNAGVRVVRTELNIDSSDTPASPWYWGTDSWNGVIANPDSIKTTREYTDVLPSASAVFDVNDSDKVRVSAARVVSRQDLFQLGQGASYNYTRSTTPGPNENRFLYTNGSGGNTELDPYRASQFDIAYERYIGASGIISGAFFYKSVDSFIQDETAPRTVADGSVEGATLGIFTQPINGEGGTIKGIELAAQYAFENGFGFNANYTYSDSETDKSNDYDNNLPIPGVAKNAFNLQGYYEGHGFEARVSYAWRDKSYQGDFAFGSGADRHNLGTWERAYGQLDAQIGYAVTPAIKVVLEGINLTEEPTGRYLQWENLPFRYATGDRRIVLGARFKLGL
ncbi:TonB-dependent receptor [Caulobacter hibisci]|uniref:TonB-dependent receptor n=1 Tax=Caulobacter hibisci TaxID=2035993 RepID=A0ABS0SSM3_9CAUL|nr:TonB-dependent receptor [Caulobacter hibisci]MBI1682494.1 TonB-dependent receptor [Caulobacter hibisci]